MGEASNDPDLTALRRRWLGSWTRGIYAGWRERRVARNTSRVSLRVFREVEAQSPELSGVERYEEVVVRQTGLDRTRARDLVRNAEDSFAAWPNERPVILRDVVQYLVVLQCLDAAPKALGVRASVAKTVAGLIPGNL